MDCIIIGYGYWGQIIKKYIVESDEFNLIGIYDTALNINQNMDDVLDKITCAFVCTPTNTHFDLVEKLLRNKIHVFCEKPLCKSLNDTEYLLRLALEKERVLFTDYIYTASSSIRCLKHYLNLLGEILYINAEIKQFGKFYASEHAFETIGVHMLSVLNFLFDCAPVKITGVEKIVCDDKGYSQAGIAYFEMKDFRGKLECSLLSDEKKRRIEIICQNGLLIFDMLAKDTVKIIAHEAKNNEKEEKVLCSFKYDENNNLKYMLTLFADAIKNKKESLQNAVISLEVARVLEDILNFE